MANDGKRFCRKCGTHHTFSPFGCKGTGDYPNPVEEEKRLKRQGNPVRELVRQPPVPVSGPSMEGWRPFGNRLASIELLGGHTIMRRKED